MGGFFHGHLFVVTNQQMKPIQDIVFTCRYSLSHKFNVRDRAFNFLCTYQLKNSC